MARRKWKWGMVLLAAAMVTLWLSSMLLAETSSLIVERMVVAGGGERATPGAYVIEATIGQSMTGRFRDGTDDFGAGYWSSEDYNVYAPIVRN